MHIRDETVEEFMRLYKEEFGEGLTMTEARAMVFRLVGFYVQLLKPLPDEKKRSENDTVAN